MKCFSRLLVLFFLFSCEQSDFEGKSEKSEESPSSTNDTADVEVSSSSSQMGDTDVDEKGPSGANEGETKDQTVKSDGPMIPSLPEGPLKLPEIKRDDTGGIVLTPELVKLACNSFVQLEASQNVSIPERTEGCGFSENGNGPAINDMFQARERLDIPLSVPENALLCSMEVTNIPDEVRYDDSVYFTLENYVLASSHKTVVDLLDLDPVTGYRVWDFNKVKGTTISFGGDKLDYCGGDTVCSLPPQDNEGTFSLSMSLNDVAPLVAALQNVEGPKFSFIVGGDDNGSDCTHSVFDLKADYTYVVPSLP